ncbi:MAG TPA: hypothetical protein VN456_03845 [Desulfosporosinus sp.]|nr:hypothetical protein [Desulfosporosinus sp.]
MKTEQLYLNVALTLDGVNEPSGLLVDVTVAEDGSYTVNKMVFLQEDLKTEEESWVVFPKEHYKFRLEVLDAGIKEEIVKAKTDPDYAVESKVYKMIIGNTTKEMIFQGGHQ